MAQVCSSSYGFYSVFGIFIKNILGKPKYLVFSVFLVLLTIKVLTPNSQFQWFLRCFEFLIYVAQFYSSSNGFSVFLVFSLKKILASP